MFLFIFGFVVEKFVQRHEVLCVCSLSLSLSLSLSAGCLLAVVVVLTGDFSSRLCLSVSFFAGFTSLYVP
jgi:hypothetical protein